MDFKKMLRAPLTSRSQCQLHGEHTNDLLPPMV